MFARDRDLLVYEPALFNELSWAGQRLLDGVTAGISGTTLTLLDGDLALAGIDVGHVLLVDGVAMEVLEVISATAALVSRVRAESSDTPTSPFGAASDLSVRCTTFLPQIALVHEQLMRALGVDVGATSTVHGRPNASQITNGRDFVRAESLGALHVVMTAAAAIAGEDGRWWSKARLYRERFRDERARVSAEIDLDGDGTPDATRRFNTMQLAR
ncbi:MAG: hypothetical protein AAGD00_00450 [Planctomycetota bacterium]